MTDAATLRSRLASLEQEAVEKRNMLLNHLKIELRNLKDEHGKTAVLDALGEFHTLSEGGRAFVEELPPSAIDIDAAARERFPTGPSERIKAG
jgi:hypothetical protein